MLEINTYFLRRFAENAGNFEKPQKSEKIQQINSNFRLVKFAVSTERSAALSSNAPEKAFTSRSGNSERGSSVVGGANH